MGESYKYGFQETCYRMPSYVILTSTWIHAHHSMRTILTLWWTLILVCSFFYVFFILSLLSSFQLSLHKYLGYISSFHGLLQAQAEKTPSAIAFITSDGRQYTYREWDILNTQSKELKMRVVFDSKYIAGVQFLQSSYVQWAYCRKIW